MIAGGTKMGTQLSELDATAQAELVRRGDGKAIELVDAAIERIERLNPQLNAVITPMFEKARAQARSAQLPDGPFRGVPYLLKDLGAHSAGDPFHGGMRFLRNLGWVAPHDTHLAAKLRAAGFIFLGKTNTPELGLLPTTEPEAYGVTRNPWDTTRSPGGSSGGAAAAVASGMVPAAHATDGGGSIRIPASSCGLVGLKPSRGRVSLGPDTGERWGGFAAENSVTRSVRDTAAILDVISGPMLGDPYAAPTPRDRFAAAVGADPGRLRIGLMIQAPNGATVHADCVAAAEAAGRALESLGHFVERSHPQAIVDPEMMRAVVTVIACATARALDGWSERTNRSIGQSDVEPLTWAVAEMGRGASARDYLRAIEFVHRQTRRLAAWWDRDGDRFDLLLTPTQAEPPPPLGTFSSPPEDPLAGFLRAAPFGAFTTTFNVTGQPAISLPLHWNDAGLPIGIQLAAAYGREDVLIQVASQLEQACPWTERRPDVHA
jgi:amidase